MIYDNYTLGFIIISSINIGIFLSNLLRKEMMLTSFFCLICMMLGLIITLTGFHS